MSRRWGRGEVVGELAMIDDSPRSASVRARGPVEMHQVEHDGFAQLRQQYHPAAYKLIRKMCAIISGRVRDRYEDLGMLLHPSAAKVAASAPAEHGFLHRLFGGRKA